VFRTIGTTVNALNFVNRHFKSLLKCAGLRDIRCHDLRHTCATLLPGPRVNPKLVQYFLRHASITITLDCYSHWIPVHGKHAAEGIMDKALG
jgi:integrase